MHPLHHGREKGHCPRPAARIREVLGEPRTSCVAGARGVALLSRVFGSAHSTEAPRGFNGVALYTGGSAGVGDMVLRLGTLTKIPTATPNSK